MYDDGEYNPDEMWDGTHWVLTEEGGCEEERLRLRLARREAAAASNDSNGDFEEKLGSSLKASPAEQRVAELQAEENDLKGQLRRLQAQLAEATAQLRAGRRHSQPDAHMLQTYRIRHAEEQVQLRRLEAAGRRPGEGAAPRAQAARARGFKLPRGGRANLKEEEEAEEAEEEAAEAEEEEAEEEKEEPQQKQVRKKRQRGTAAEEEEEEEEPVAKQKEPKQPLGRRRQPQPAPVKDEEDAPAEEPGQAAAPQQPKQQGEGRDDGLPASVVKPGKAGKAAVEVGAAGKEGEVEEDEDDVPLGERRARQQRQQRQQRDTQLAEQQGREVLQPPAAPAAAPPPPQEAAPAAAAAAPEATGAAAADAPGTKAASIPVSYDNHYSEGEAPRSDQEGASGRDRRAPARRTGGVRRVTAVGSEDEAQAGAAADAKAAAEAAADGGEQPAAAAGGMPEAPTVAAAAARRGRKLGACGAAREPAGGEEPAGPPAAPKTLDELAARPDAIKPAGVPSLSGFGWASANKDFLSDRTERPVDLSNWWYGAKLPNVKGTTQRVHVFKEVRRAVQGRASFGCNPRPFAGVHKCVHGCPLAFSCCPLFALPPIRAPQGIMELAQKYEDLTEHKKELEKLKLTKACHDCQGQHVFWRCASPGCNCNWSWCQT